MGSNGADLFLCETCLERGRRRRAQVVTEDLQMCADCYGGKPTCKAETIGGGDEARARWRRRYEEKRRRGSARRKQPWRRTDKELAGAMLGKKSKLRVASSEQGGQR